MDIDVDPFDEHGKKDEATGGGDDETIPLIPAGGTQIDPYGNGEKETSFGVGGLVTSLRNEVLKENVRELYKNLDKAIKQNPLYYNENLFEIKGKDLYFKGLDRPLTTRGRLKTINTIVDLLGKRRLIEMGFVIPEHSNAREFIKLRQVRRELEEKLPSASEITKADEIEMQEITRKAIDANEDLIKEISSDRGTQTGEDDPDMPTMRELVGLDKELRSIRGSLKVEAAKKVEIEQHIEREKRKLEEIRDNPEYDDGIRNDIRNRIERLNDDLKVREESIDLLKGRLKNQITSFRETIAKVLDKDATLGERIRTLFREQGITIFSILTAIGMAIGVLVEAILPGSTAASTTHSAGDTPGSAKEWIRNKLRALALLLGKLAEKAGAALPGIIGSVVAWLLNRAKEVVGWISKNLWSLILLLVWMVYDYMKKPQSASKKK